MFEKWISAGKSVFAQLAEKLEHVIAPPGGEPVEDLEYHWNSFKVVHNALVKLSEDPAVSKLDKHIKSASSHLMAMVEILIEEVKQMREAGKADEAGPCIEFVLSKTVIEELCNIGRENVPAGMTQISVKFLVNVLSKVQFPLLHNVEVHRAIMNLIRVGSEREEVESVAGAALCDLVYAICRRVSANRILLTFFLDYEIDIGGHPGGVPSDFLVFRTAIHHLHAPRKQGERAWKSIALCLELGEPAISLYAFHKTNLAHVVAESLSDSFSALVEDSERCAAIHAERTTEESLAEAKARKTHTRELLAEFTFKLEHFDRFCECGFADLVSQLCSSFNDKVLAATVGPALLHTREAVAADTLEWIAYMLTKITSSALAVAVVAFFLAGGDEKDLAALEERTDPPLAEQEKDDSCLVRSTLLYKLDALSPEVSTAAMKVFHALLGLRLPEVYNNLVLRNFFLMTPFPIESKVTFSGLDGADGELLRSVGLAAERQDSDSYKKDASDEIALNRAAMASNSELEPRTPDARSRADGFYEGPFLEILLSKLASASDMSVESIVVLSGILTRIAAWPVCPLSHYMLNPKTSLSKGTRSLPQVLRSVHESLIEQVEATGQRSGEMLATARQAMTISELSDPEQMKNVQDEFENFEKRDTLRIVVILEEFTKELAATASCMSQLS